jgi:uncharacterized damage-inducible protein DinB
MKAPWGAPPLGLADVYAGWALHQAELIRVIRPLDANQLALRPPSGHWAIWQLASNMAGGRAYWFCEVLGEGHSGLRDMFRVHATTVPGLSLADAGWEDDENHPRSAAELVRALELTWDLIRNRLGQWTAMDLEETLPARAGRHPTVKRGWVIWHLIEHELQHGTEIAVILRDNGLPTIEL